MRNCPVCGARAEVVYNLPTGTFRGGCRSSKCCFDWAKVVGYKPTQEAAEDEWNRVVDEARDLLNKVFQYRRGRNIRTPMGITIWQMSNDAGVDAQLVKKIYQRWSDKKNRDWDAKKDAAAAVSGGNP